MPLTLVRLSGLHTTCTRLDRLGGLGGVGGCVLGPEDFDNGDTLANYKV